MMRWLKQSKIAIWALTGLAGLTMLFSFSGTAAAIDLFGDACSRGGSGSAACSQKGGTNNLTGPTGIITKATSVIAVIAGIAAVIILMIGGFNYITSSGDSSKVSSAKSTIIYAIVGLVVIFVARSIVTFILSRV